MQVQVSLTIEIGASASLTEMEEQIQEAGKPAMREALKQASNEKSKRAAVRTVGSSSADWRERCAES